MAVDFDSMPLAYENEHYKVVIDASDATTPYRIVNKQHGVCESLEENLPQALILAKQFSILLEDDNWAKQVDDMYGRTTSLGVVSAFNH